MKFFFLFLLILTRQGFSQGFHFEKIEIDTNYSFRGLSVVDDSVAWVSGNGFGRSVNGGKNWIFKKVKNFDQLDFRTLFAFDGLTAIIANAGSPAYILRTVDGGKNWIEVYKNNDSLAFFDGIDFWNDQEGIIYGDPIKGRMLLLRTKDGGQTWQEFPEENRPQLSEGEASFAASGTGIRCYNEQKVMIATGGKVSRLLISNDKGQKWNATPTPISQGKNSTGIFSFAFLNDTAGIIVGGDYLNDTMKSAHVFYTTDSGRKWSFPTVPTGGYRECVEFITEKIAITVGPGGADVSYNAGKDWSPIENEKSFHVLRKTRKGKLIIAAGNKKISLVNFK